MSYQNCKVDRYHNITVLSSPWGGRDVGGNWQENLSTADKQIEKCKGCGELLVYHYKPNGSMTEERQYFLDHIRDFAQNDTGDSGMQVVFDYCKPELKQRFMKLAAEKVKSDEFQADMEDRFQWALKRALNNEGWKMKTKDGFDRSSREK